MAVATRTGLVEELMARFPHIPPEAVLKEDLLRTGIAFDDSALTDNLDGEVKPKSYFIFSFDQKPLARARRGGASAARPEEIALSGGPYELRRTIVSVRVNPDSPYRVARDDDGALRLSLDGRELADVELPPMPEYYRHTLANGKTVMETAPTIQWGYLIYLTVLRLCQYFGAKEECGFCDINHNWRQHKKEGRPYTGVKPVEDVLEALALIDRYDTAKASQGVHAHRRLGHERPSTGSPRPTSTAATRRRSRSASPAAGSARSSRRRCRRPTSSATRTTGSRSTTRTTRSGTSASSRSSRPARSATSAARSGTAGSSTRPTCSAPRYVIPNFVAGVEMAKPFGFETVDEAIASTTEGLDYFMSRGITPRFTTWCPEPTTPLGRDNPDGAPLEYHIRLLEAYRETLERHGLEAAARATASRARATPSSRSARSWTRCARSGHVEEAVPA